MKMPSREACMTQHHDAPPTGETQVRGNLVQYCPACKAYDHKADFVNGLCAACDRNGRITYR